MALPQYPSTEPKVLEQVQRLIHTREQCRRQRDFDGADGASSPKLSVLGSWVGLWRILHLYLIPDRVPHGLTQDSSTVADTLVLRPAPSTAPRTLSTAISHSQHRGLSPGCSITVGI